MTRATRPTTDRAALPLDWDSAYVEQLPRVYNYFRSMDHAQHEVEQRTTRTFEQAWRARRHYRGDRAGFEARLLAIAHELGDAIAPASHRPASEPPAAFAAKLRARLEMLELAEQLRARQRRAYGVVGSLLVVALIVLATPPLRDSTQQLLQQWQMPWIAAQGDSPMSVSTVSELPASYEPDADSVDELGPDTSRASRPRQRVRTALSDSAAPPAVSGQGGQRFFVSLEARPAASGLRASDSPARVGGSKLALLLVSLKASALRVASSQAWSHEAAFKQFCSGALDVVVSARPIVPAALADCATAGTEFIELPLAYAGVAVIENHDNVWADPLETRTLLGLIGDARVPPARRWNELGTYWPEANASLLVLRETRGWSEFFAELTGEPISSEIGLRRGAAELLAAVREDPYAIGLLPIGYFLDNEARLPSFIKSTRVVDVYSNPVRPSRQSLVSRYYVPLSRLLLLYVNVAATKRARVHELLQSLLEPKQETLAQTVFLDLEPDEYQQALRKVAERRVGSLIGRQRFDGLSAAEILRGWAFARPF